MKPKESDWKEYRQLIPSWRDRYLKDKNDELVAILNDSGKSPTERFWEARERLEEEAGVLNHCLGSISRSKMWRSLLMMRRYGLIKDEDLAHFSEDLRRDLTRIIHE